MKQPPKPARPSFDEGTRERILAAALECISSTSVGRLSVRAIAARAGVNVATVHYHFGTKDELISEAFRLFFAPIAARIGAALDAEAPPRARLESLLGFYVEHFHEHPGIFTSFIEALIASNIKKEPGVVQGHERVLLEMVGGFRDRLLDLVSEVTAREDRQDAALLVIHLVASVVHPLVISSLPATLFGLDFAEEATRRRYVSLLVEGIAGSGEGLRPKE